MYIPQKAIIAAPTQEDARKLFDFLGERGYTFSGSIASGSYTRWEWYKGNTCYNLVCPDCSIQYSGRSFYEGFLRKFDAGNPKEVESSFGKYSAPEDPEFRFISVGDFIARCIEEDEDSDLEIDVDELV